MKEEKFAALAVKVWRAKNRVDQLRKHGPSARFEDAKNKLRLAFVKFETAVRA